MRPTIQHLEPHQVTYELVALPHPLWSCPLWAPEHVVFRRQRAGYGRPWWPYLRDPGALKFILQGYARYREQDAWRIRTWALRCVAELERGGQLDLEKLSRELDFGIQDKWGRPWTPEPWPGRLGIAHALSRLWPGVVSATIDAEPVWTPCGPRPRSSRVGLTVTLADCREGLDANQVCNDPPEHPSNFSQQPQKSTATGSLAPTWLESHSNTEEEDLF